MAITAKAEDYTSKYLLYVYKNTPNRSWDYVTINKGSNVIFSIFNNNMGKEYYYDKISHNSITKTNNE